MYQRGKRKKRKKKPGDMLYSLKKLAETLLTKTVKYLFKRQHSCKGSIFFKHVGTKIKFFYVCSNCKCHLICDLISIKVEKTETVLVILSIFVLPEPNTHWLFSGSASRSTVSLHTEYHPLISFGARSKSLVGVSHL